MISSNRIVLNQYQLDEKYSFVKELFLKLRKTFQDPYYSLRIRGSWAVYIYAIFYNEESDDSKIDLNSIQPDDLDLCLCYVTSKHDKKLDPSIKTLELQIDKKNYSYETQQQDAQSKTFLLKHTDVSKNSVIESIDIYRLNAIPKNFYLIDNLVLMNPEKILNDYLEDPEIDFSMSYSEIDDKRKRHENKKNIMKKIVDWIKQNSKTTKTNNFIEKLNFD